MAIGGLCVSRDLCGQMKNSSNRLWLPHSLWSLSVTTCSVAKSCPSLQSQGPQHTRLPCSSLSARVCSNSCSRVSDATWPSHPLLPFSLSPSIFGSIRVFSNESTLLIRWPEYWTFSCSISPSHEYSGLISFTIDSFDFLAVQETLKSLLQHHNLKASILWSSVFFIVQLSIHTWLLEKS